MLTRLRAPLRISARLGALLPQWLACGALLLAPLGAQQEPAAPPAPPAPAQDAPRPSPEQELAAKLASPFLQRAPWQLDWDQARAAARRDGKLIFGYFTTAGY